MKRFSYGYVIRNGKPIEIERPSRYLDAHTFWAYAVTLQRDILVDTRGMHSNPPRIDRVVRPDDHDFAIWDRIAYPPKRKRVKHRNECCERDRNLPHAFACPFYPESETAQ